MFRPLYRKNFERNAQQKGAYKRSTEYIKEQTRKTLIRRITEASKYAQPTPKLTDPRLNNRNSLFGPPRKLESPSKSHNRSQPNIKVSIFGDSNAEEFSSDSSSSESSGSPPGANGKLFEKHNSTSIANNDSWGSSSDSDDVLPFGSFNNKRKNPSNDQPLKKKPKLNESNDSQKNKRKLSPTKSATIPSK